MRANNQPIRFGLLLTAASFVCASAYAAAPTVGSVIGNQATATYENMTGDTISVTSNKVETIVQQVAGVTLVADNSETVARGGKVFLPHTITNDGNGSDIFDLTAIEGAGGDYDFTSIKIYPDANFDGVADSTTPITITPTLTSSGQPGSSFGIVIEATVPSGAVADDFEDITVTAVSQFDTSINDTNTDDVTITDGPVTEIVKSMTVDKGVDGITGPGDVVTITLQYTSTGLTAADDLIVTDVLDKYLDYTTGTAYWSDDTDLLTEADDAYEQQNGSLHSIDFQYSENVASDEDDDTVTFQIDSVPSGRTGSVTFKATIRSDAPAGDIPNVATQTVDGEVFPPSNKATITVEPVYQVTAADAQSTTYQVDPDGDAASGNDGNLAGTVSATDTDGNLNDIVEEDTATPQGGSMTFQFVLTNQSNASDSIEVNLANDATNPFPAGTTFQLVGADGATPVVGPLGPLAPGATAIVNVIATLAPDATAAADGTTNYEAVLSAQSINGGPVNTSTALFTGAVTAVAVDLQNKDTTGDGAFPRDGTDPWHNHDTLPGEPVTYVVTVENLGSTSDTYDLSLNTPLPTGWTATFLLPDGTPVTNTGVIPGNGSVDITVVVTPPEDGSPGLQEIDMKVTSPSTGQGDTLVNSVTIEEVIDVAISSDQSVQGAPGGTIDIPHTIENQGNIAITDGAITQAGTFADFSGTIFYDVNGNGVVDPAEATVIDDINDIGGLAVGASKSLIHRVSIPSTGAVGLSESETITVSSTLNTSKTDGDTTDNAVTDTIKIVSGDLTLLKEQAVDADCDGTLGAFSQTSVQAQPGQCIRYRITATNSGTDEAQLVTIRDTVPTFTTLFECSGVTTCESVSSSGGFEVKPANGSTGPIRSGHGTLIGGDVATMSFTVKIDE